MIYFFLSLVQVLAKLCGCWMDHGELYCSDQLDGILGLLFLSSFAMRSFGGSAKAYGDVLGNYGTFSRLFDCML
jgi:hypothetical protein